MSTATEMPETPDLSHPASQYDDFIDQRLLRTSFHLKTLDLVSGLILLGLFVLGSLLCIVFVDHWIWPLSVPARFAAMLGVPGVGLLIGLKYLLLPLTRAINPEYAALTVEQAHPELKNGLINFLFFRDRTHLLRRGVFQGMQAQTAADLTQVPIDSAIDRSSIIKWGYVLVALAVIWVGYILLSPKNPLQTIARVAMPWREIARPSQVDIQQVLPGDVEVYRGQTVDVQARIVGLPDGEQPTIVFSTRDGQLVDQQIPLASDEIANRFVGTLSMGTDGLLQDLEYRIQAGDAESRPFEVRILDIPHIRVDGIQLDYPTYTEQADALVQGEGDIRAIEGTRVTVLGKANQAIGHGQIVFAPTNPSDTPRRAALKVDGTVDTEAAFRFPLRMNGDRTQSLYRAYHLEFTNAAGQSSTHPIEHSIEVLPDRRPVVDILTPDRRTIEVPENGVQKIEVRAVDPDFKLTRVQIAARTRGRNLFRENLLTTTRASEWHEGQFTAVYLFTPRDFGLKAGDVVEYLALAEDNRHGLNQSKLDPNRTISAKQFIRIVQADPLAQQRNKNQNEDPNKADDTRSEDSSPQDQNPQDPKPKDQNQQGANQQNGEPQAGEDQQGEGNQPQQSSSQDDGESGSEESGKSGGEQSGLQQDSNRSGETDQESEGGGNPGESSDSETGADSTSEGSGGDPSSGPDDASDPNSGDGGPSGNAGDDASSGRSGGPSDREQRGAREDEPLPSSGERDGEVVERIREHMREKGDLPESQRSSESEDESDTGSDSGSGDDEEPGSSNSPSSSNSNSDADPNSPQTGEDAQSVSDRDQRPDATSNGANSQDPSGEDPSSPGEEQAPGQGGASGDTQDDKQEGQGAQNDAGGSPQTKDPGDGTGASGGPENDDPSSNPSAQPDAGSSSTGQGQREDAGDQAGESEAGDDAASSGNARTKPGQQGEPTESQPTEGQTTDPSTGEPKDPSNDPGANASENGNAGQQGKSGQGQDAKPQDAQQSETENLPSQQPADASSQSSKSSQGDANGKSRNANSQTGRTEPGNPQSSSGDGNATSGEGGESGDAAAGDAANLEYAREATNLVLEYLKDQKNQTDPELLDKLGWNQEDVEKFLRRWDQMKKNAQGTDPVSQKHKSKLDELLQGMGLQGAPAEVRRGADTKDQQRDNRNTGRKQKVPADLLDPFRAFQRGLQFRE